MNNHFAHNSVRLLRYIPVVSFLLMFAHVVLLIHGIDIHIAEIGVIVMGYIISYLFSKAFGFCLLHRLLIYYAFSVMVCIWFRRLPEGEYGLFGEHIDAARWFMFIVGSLIFSLLILKATRKK